MIFLKIYVLAQKPISIALAVIFLIVLPFSARVALATDDADLFKEMTADIPIEAESESYPWIKKFGDNFEGSLRLKYKYLFNNPNNAVLSDSNKSIGEVLFRFSTWSGNDNLKVFLSGWAEAGTQTNTYRGVTHWLIDEDYYRRYFELNEFYAVLSRENIDFTFGKKLFNTGICTLFSPSDRFRPSDLHDPLDPKQFGLWQIKADYYLKDYKFEFALMPVYTDHKPPAPDLRWWGADFNWLGKSSVISDSPNISLEYVNYFAKFKTTKKGWDIFFSMSSGPSPYSVVQIKRSIPVEKIIRVNTLAGGFSTTIGGFEIHGEILYNKSEKDRDDDYLSTVIGFNYALNNYADYFFMEEILFTFEYAKEVILDKQSADGYIQSSKHYRLGRKDLILRMQFKYDESLKFENVFHYDISDQAWMNRFEVSYRLGAGWTCVGAIETFKNNNEVLASADKVVFDTISYGQWDKNDRAVFYIKYEF